MVPPARSASASKAPTSSGERTLCASSIPGTPWLPSAVHSPKTIPPAPKKGDLVIGLFGPAPAKSLIARKRPRMPRSRSTVGWTVGSSTAISEEAEEAALGDWPPVVPVAGDPDRWGAVSCGVTEGCEDEPGAGEETVEEAGHPRPPWRSAGGHRRSFRTCARRPPGLSERTSRIRTRPLPRRSPASRPGAFRPQGQELFGVAGQLLFREAGDEIPQRHGLIE
jgi:hypothetical protein